MRGQLAKQLSDAEETWFNASAAYDDAVNLTSD